MLSIISTTLLSFTDRRAGDRAFWQVALSITGDKWDANIRARDLLDSALVDEHESEDNKRDAAIKDAYRAHPSGARQPVFCRPIPRWPNHRTSLSFALTVFWQQLWPSPFG